MEFGIFALISKAVTSKFTIPKRAYSSATTRCPCLNGGPVQDGKDGKKQPCYVTHIVIK
jgi:hypothetical protein